MLNKVKHINKIYFILSQKNCPTENKQNKYRPLWTSW